MGHSLEGFGERPFQGQMLSSWPTHKTEPDLLCQHIGVC